MEKTEIKKYYVIVFLIILVYLGYLIIKDYIPALLTSFILAYLFFPLYKKLRTIAKSEVISSLLVTILVISILLLPLGFIANSLIKESANIINSNAIQDIEAKVVSYITQERQLAKPLSTISEKGLEYIKNQASLFIISLPSKLISLIIAAFALFYSFIIGESLVKTVKQTLPIKRKEELLNHIGNTTYAIVYGLFATAIIEFIIAAVGFKLLGVSSPFILALIIGLLTLIPFLGPIIVWLPLTIMNVISREYPKAIGITILGVVMSLSETLIRAKIIGEKSKIHPVIVLLGIIGGVQVIGFIGIIVGPIILSTLVVILKEYYPVKNNEIKS